MFEMKCVVLLNLIAAIHCGMEGFIVGGKRAAIIDFPHSAYLSVKCDKNPSQTWMCGASVLNQDLLLTAAHCLDGCPRGMIIFMSAGHSKRLNGHTSYAQSYVKHHLYIDSTNENDIGMVRMFRRVKFSSRLSRVAIMKRPPISKEARIAGWGVIDEIRFKKTDYLMKLNQTLWSRKDCLRVYIIPQNTFCASSNVNNKYVSSGDSGSALVIRDYIQIGIVSFKYPHISRNLIVYTNVSSYYTWIQKQAKKLYCSDKNKIVKS